MPVVTSPDELIELDIYVHLRPMLHRDLYLKCEGFNFGGSIKMRAAAAMVAAAERDGLLCPDSILVESSSGNLGVALSVIAASKRFEFTCVTDQHCNRTTVELMRALGTRVIVIDQPDPVDGLLGARKAHVRQLCRSDNRYVWLNQYENPANWQAHYENTAPAIAKRFPDLDVIFVGTGTGGTLMGLARYFREHADAVRIIAVDVRGSVNLGGPADLRHIPGLGSSVVAPGLDLAIVDDTIYVTESDTVRACRSLTASGFLFGGSTGTVVSGAMAWLGTNDHHRRLTSLAIAPDLGERYLGTVYDDQWVAETLGPKAVEAEVWARGPSDSTR
jgi:N-(2-amino-2-carboxyethyl)-L-glutamate synthase